MPLTIQKRNVVSCKERLDQNQFFKIITLISWALLIAANSFAQGTFKNESLGNIQEATPFQNNATDINFIENKGQWDKNILYKADFSEGTFFLTTKGMDFKLVSITDAQRFQENLHEGRTDSLPIHKHNYTVEFLNANASDQVQSYGVQPRNFYQNYFIGNDSTKWKGHVRVFGKIVLEQIYQGVNFEAYPATASQPGGLEYDFIVKPGFDPSVIQLKYHGVQPKLLPNGNLSIATSVNTMIEEAPVSYQVINGERVVVKSHFKLTDNVVSFVFPDGYQKDFPLYIDPIVFATYSGGSGNQFYYAYGTTFDLNGNVYASALNEILYDTINRWPTTVGAFQVTGYNLPFLAVINKYSADGTTLLYSTYYGGFNGDLQPNSLRVDEDNNLVIAGSTSSSTLPITSNAYQPTLAGGNDLYLARLSEDGSTLINATYLGGSSPEGSLIGSTSSITGLAINNNSRNPVEITFDSTNAVWITSNSGSTDFPVTPNALQSVNNGNFDVVVAKLSNDFSSLLYSTYLGGSGWDGGISIELDHNGDPVIVGSTGSSNFPTTNGVLNPMFIGSQDGFVTRLSAANGNLLQSSFLGTTTLDDAQRVAFDGDGNVFVVGRSNDGQYPITPGAYLNPNNSSGAIYIQKLDSVFTTSLASTRLGFGPSPLIVPTGFMVDGCGKVYLGTVNLSAQIGMELTPNAFQTTPSNFYLVVLSNNLDALEFGSYFGTTFDHYHASVSRLDPNGIYYQSLCSTSANYTPYTAGSVFPTKQNFGTNNDCVTFKFQFPLPQISTAIQILDTASGHLCAPYPVIFDNQTESSFNPIFTWDFGDGSPVSHQSNPTHIYNAPGTYTIRLIASSDSVCYVEAMDSVTITLVGVVPDTVEHQIVGCDMVSFLGVDYHSDTVVYQHFTYPYGCDSLVKVEKIKVNHTRKDTTHSFICRGETIDFHGQTVTKPGFYKYTTVGQQGCDSIMTLDLKFYPDAEISIQGADSNKFFCEGDEINLTGAGAPTFSWWWTGQDDTVFAPSVRITMGDENIAVDLKGVNEWGCLGEDDLILLSGGCCQAFIPNAFTPNGDGLNDGFRVETLGTYVKYELAIFDRYGRRVFLSFTQGEYWNGTSAGIKCDLGTYFYVFKGTCIDGHTIRRKGDVTLIR